MPGNTPNSAPEGRARARARAGSATAAIHGDVAVHEHNAAADRRRNPAWTLVVASLALMMSFLDALVVTTALPTLRVSLHSSLASLEWTVNAYNLSFACLLLTGAALGDRFGRRRMLCIGLAIFVGASLLAGSAPAIGVLVGPGHAGGRRGDHGAADPHPGHRRLPTRTPRMGDRHLERSRGPERSYRTVHRRCRRAGNRVALDLLDQRPGRPGADLGRAVARPRKPWRLPAPGHRRGGPRHHRAAGGHLGHHPHEHGRAGAARRLPGC
jgi:Major Facilitator Superfamily